MKVLLLFASYILTVSTVLAQTTFQLRLYDGNETVYVQANISDAQDIIFKSPKFNRSVDTVFLIHGFTSNTDELKGLISAFLLRRINVIGVDWRDLAYYATNPVQLAANLPKYPLAAFNTRIVGGAVATLVNKLNADKIMNISKVICVGHSLGAQTCGYIGRNVVTKLPYIMGLDPAGPMFGYYFFSIQTISKTDAEIVHVLHTDGGVLGIFSSDGTANFKINGGSRIQPGCSVVFGFEVSCSHSRAVEYFAEAVRNPNTFASVKCKNLYQFIFRQCSVEPVYIGYPPDASASGVYFLETNNQSAFAKGLDGTKSFIKYENVELF